MAFAAPVADPSASAYALRHEQEVMHEIREEADYAPLADFVDNPPTPEKGCLAYAAEIAAVLPCLQFFDEVVYQCRLATRRKQDQPDAVTINDLRMVFAIVLFTFDLCLIKTPDQFETQNNFYFQFNNMLRARNGNFLKEGHGFLYLLMTGLSRLPPISGYVYRGISPEKAGVVLNKFKKGLKVHFSATSSTTWSLAVAQRFAAGGGVILRFNLLDSDSMSRNISSLSMFKEEEEILLLPNFRCVVELVKNEGSYSMIDLLELQEEGLVDFG